MCCMRTALVLLTVALSPLSGQAQSSQVAAKIEAAIARITPNDVRPVVIRIALTVPPGWHIGATTPGSAGLPTRVRWIPPPGWQLIENRWPQPVPLVVGADTLLVYRESVHLDGSFQVEPSRARGPLKAVISYGLCRDICIPGQLEVTLPEPLSPAEDNSPSRSRSTHNP
jgi:DsbC/DsbD-like thiol-disulfide interchange protein